MTNSDVKATIKAVIFDMDGLLLDSESLYTTISNEILAPFNKQLTWEIKAILMGRPALESATLLVEKTGIPMAPEDLIAAMSKRQVEMFPNVKPMPGAERLVKYLHENKIPLAIATGSVRRNFDLKRTNLADLFDPFGENVVCGDSPELKRGKPSPDPFLLAARLFLGLEISPDEQGFYHALDDAQIAQLSGIRPDEILVFEDGLAGVRSAKAAGMRVIWVPDPELKKLQISQGEEPPDADQVLNSLEEWDGPMWGLPAMS
ncbi:hypothetical protein CROQUDRAFT_619026 [Cronartium quercuum f. sp. fusiforme G11]|uniref:Uncharacterized protein n=1 Tax=Cronartium quercuum f. sp. fusiforme G11 TaxID=708437 RepID=A0A9P6T9U9_9BASI|nr:hypothetical protein CROQUDRAFT_619026 [Cronartium quercuum f. sp. fusiforme G11]